MSRAKKEPGLNAPVKILAVYDAKKKRRTKPVYQIEAWKYYSIVCELGFLGFDRWTAEEIADWAARSKDADEREYGDYTIVIYKEGG